MLYKYQNQVIPLVDDRISVIMQEVEQRRRTGEFKYSPLAMTPEQVSTIKSNWPPDMLSVVAALAKAIPEQDPPKKAFQAIFQTATNEFAKKRSETKFEAMVRQASADLSLSMLFKVMPESSLNFSPRTIEGRKIAVQVSTHLPKLIVNCKTLDDEQTAANTYVLSFYSERLRRAWLLGWLPAKDLKAKRGNRITDSANCNWDQMKYWAWPQDLKPMASLMREHGIKETYDGIVIESIPEAAELPIPPLDRTLDAFLSAPDAKADFYTSIFGKEAAPQPQPQAEAKPSEDVQF